MILLSCLTLEQLSQRPCLGFPHLQLRHTWVCTHSLNDRVDAFVLGVNSLWALSFSPLHILNSLQRPGMACTPVPGITNNPSAMG
jgi:hypothetical protein